MNTYYITDEVVQNSQAYKDFMSSNSSSGMLKIRAYAASEAVPIEGLKVTVSTIIDGNKIIFFEGYTNESGVIDNISLPAPKLIEDNLVSPLKTEYEILSTYLPDKNVQLFKVYMFEDICVLQNINVIPDAPSKSEAF